MSLVSDGLTLGERAPSDIHSPSIRLLNISMVISLSLHRLLCRLVYSRMECRLPPGLFPPRREIGQCLLIGRGIKPKDRAALADFFRDKILERRHLELLAGDLLSEQHG